MGMLVIIDMIPLHFLKVNEPKVISNFGSFIIILGLSVNISGLEIELQIAYTFTQ